MKEPFDHADCYSRKGSRQSFVLFNYNFSGRTGRLGGRSGAHRQPQADSTVLLQIQTGSLGNPPTPSSGSLWN
jgi:hypothetical protein